jgi:DNA-binding Xre family transcriptional regulator
MAGRHGSTGDARPIGQGHVNLDSDVAQLYNQRWTRTEIAQRLGVRIADVHKSLTGLFALGMPKTTRCMTEAQVRAIHAAHLDGASIDRLAEAIGFTGAGARRQLHRRKLALRRRSSTRKRKTARARDQHEMITGLVLLTRVDELRQQRGLTLEDLAKASGLSLSALKYMRAHLSDPKLSTLLKLCRGLGVTPGELVEGLPVPTKPRAKSAAR